VPLAERDAPVREAIARLDGEIDIAAVTAAWESALRAPVWAGPPVWVHGDLSAGNLLVRQGSLAAVIDFGGLAVGDQAVDALVAWNLFSGESREAFRAALGLDEAAWARGRGWALSVALIALPYYLRTEPGIVAGSRHAIAEVLADQPG
jgi:aminoglycoside phosphotransferase (APT) family kinase protein